MALLFYSKSGQWTFNPDSVRVPYTALSTQHSDPNKTTGIGGKLNKDNVQAYKDRGKIPESWWTKFSPVGRIKHERNGYPTQKPLALLNRIIQASSNPGDLVLDPFAGCGTTAQASLNFKRRFIGIDVSTYTIRQVCAIRLKNAADIEIQGMPTDFSSARDLAHDNHFEFEQWAVSCLPGMLPNAKPGADGGVDGRGILLVKPMTDGTAEDGLVITQVKGGGFAPDAYRALLSQIAGGKVSVGLFITLNKQKITPSMAQAITDAGVYTLAGGASEWRRLIFWSIEEYFAGIEPRLPELAHPLTGRIMPKQIQFTHADDTRKAR